MLRSAVCCLESQDVLIGVQKWEILSFTHCHVVSNQYHCILRSTKKRFNKMFKLLFSINSEWWSRDYKLQKWRKAQSTTNVKNVCINKKYEIKMKVLNVNCSLLSHMIVMSRKDSNVHYSVKISSTLTLKCCIWICIFIFGVTNQKHARTRVLVKGKHSYLSTKYNLTFYYSLLIYYRFF